MCLNSISIKIVMLLAITGCQRPAATMPAPQDNAETTLGTLFEWPAPSTPYLDTFLGAPDELAESSSNPSREATTAEPEPTPQPRSRIQRQRERGTEPKPISPTKSPEMAESAAPPEPKSVVTLKIIIQPPVMQQIVAAHPVTEPAAAKAELPVTPSPVTVTAKPSIPEWPRELGTLRRSCGHTATLWLLAPNQAMLTSEPSCRCGTSNVEIAAAWHANANILNTYNGEPGWRLSYCARCKKYFLNRK